MLSKILRCFMLRRILRACCVGKNLSGYCVENDSEACRVGKVCEWMPCW